jgi:hypothetical protein
MKWAFSYRKILCICQNKEKITAQIYCVAAIYFWRIKSEAYESVK